MAPFRMFWFQAGWVYINWALGLQDNGCELYLLEAFRKEEDPQEVLARVRRSRANLDSIGIRAELAFYWTEKQEKVLAPVLDELMSLGVPLEKAVHESELLVNFYYSLNPDVVKRFRRTALIDIDPGLLQIWSSEGQLQIAPHHMYFSIGETVGKPGAHFPDLGVPWHFTPPAVHLPTWPIVPAPEKASYTTVTSWWGTHEEFRGEVFNNEKRTSFMEYADLPLLTSVPLELSAYLTDAAVDDADRRNLEEKGWRVKRAQNLGASPERYRSYIQESRGEFSCAKPSCMRLQNAWVSDRTLCYLASGKPAVVQDTGPSGYLPRAEGLFRFGSMEEAVRAFEVIEADYAAQSRKARELAEEYFDAGKVARGVLERAMSVPPRSTG